MKIPFLPMTPLALLLLGGCNPNGAKTPPQGSGSTKTITLGQDEDLPDLAAGDHLDFVYPGAGPGESYWISFPKKTPCKSGEKYLHGTSDAHPQCEVKHAHPNSGFIYNYGKDGTPVPATGLTTDGLIICKAC